MLAIGGTAIIALLSWMTYAFFKQGRDVASFTDPKPRTLALTEHAQELLPAVQQRLAAYAAAIEAKQAAELVLSVADLNVLLSADPALESIRQNFRVEQITDHVLADVSWPMNGIGEQRYFNGQVRCQPVVKPSSGLMIETKSLEVPGREVTPGFVNLYKEMNFLDDMLLKAFREHPTEGPPLKATTAVVAAQDAIILQYTPP